MKAMEAVKMVMERQGVTNGKLSARLNKKQNVISQRFAQDNISVKVLDEMLRVMDYRIVVLPSDVATPKGGIEIE